MADAVTTTSRIVLAALLLLAGSARAEPAAWRVADSEMTELWLLGSVHYLREQDYPLPALVEHLYTQADALVMEIDLDDLDPASVQTRFMQAAMLPADRPLSSVLPADVYATAQTTARALGLELKTLERFEPWLVALTLMDLGMARMGYRADRGLEQHLLLRARQDGKAVYGLETLADQISVFDGLALPEQQALLAQTLEEIDTPEQDMDELLAAWRAGRLETLTDKLAASFADFPGLYAALVVERNRRWVDELERLARRPGHYLVVVGALHLVGEDNVIELLRGRGIRAAPISATAAW